MAGDHPDGRCRLPRAPEGAAATNREMVAHELAATAGEDRLPSDEARPDYWLLLAENHLTRRLFGSKMRRIAALPQPTG